MERNVTMIALFAALIAVLGLIPRFDLASGVPITAQSLGVMLCGTVLGARKGALAVLLFLLLVALGLAHEALERVESRIIVVRRLTRTPEADTDVTRPASVLPFL